MTSLVERAIIETLVYADLFDCPLTEEEIWKRVIKIKNQKLVPSAVEGSKIKNIIKNSKLIRKKDGFYYLGGKEEIVALRQNREKWSEEKLKIAEKTASFLQFIPTIKLIGITGASALKNAKEDDDIDLFIVTSQGLLWTTRFLATFLTEVTGRRRHPGETNVIDKICLNMFVDEDHLSVPSSERDLFSAHEVMQMKPLYEKNDTYQKFLQANLWIKNYLPNGINIKYQISKIKNANQISKIFFSFLIFICNFTFIEKQLRYLQLWYMREKRTNEVLNDGIIRFHPQDARKWVLKKYHQRLSDLGF